MDSGVANPSYAIGDWIKTSALEGRIVALVFQDETPEAVKNEFLPGTLSSREFLDVPTEYLRFFIQTHDGGIHLITDWELQPQEDTQ